jgi:hypothetical protein
MKKPQAMATCGFGLKFIALEQPDAQVRRAKVISPAEHKAEALAVI